MWESFRSHYRLYKSVQSDLKSISGWEKLPVEGDQTVATIDLFLGKNASPRQTCDVERSNAERAKTYCNGMHNERFGDVRL